MKTKDALPAWLIVAQLTVARLSWLLLDTSGPMTAPFAAAAPVAVAATTRAAAAAARRRARCGRAIRAMVKRISAAAAKWGCRAGSGRPTGAISDDDVS